MKVGFRPSKCHSSKSEPIVKMLEKNFVVQRVKRRRGVKQHNDDVLVVIDSSKDAIR